MAVFAGRLVSLTAFFFVLWGIFAAAVRLGCTRSEGAFAALLFALGMLSFTDYVAMNDPQMLAHALATGGFLILLKAPRTGRRIGAAALLFVLAFFVKHNVAVMAAAMLLWLFFADRKAALRLAGVRCQDGQ